MSRVRVVFLGTPDFAVESLKALIEDDHFDVVGVITQPDRPSGRRLQLTPSPVKVLAQLKQIKVLSPESLRDNLLILDEIRSWSAEIAVVVAFGQILTDEFLKIFPYGVVNVHGSLLPRWRGAAPIQRAIEFGDQETGVTLQRVVKKLDAGDILGVRKVPILEKTTARDLYKKLALLGADLLRVELMDFIRGNLAPFPQDEAQVTFARKIEKTESLINWTQSANQIDCKIRAFDAGPGAYTYFRGKKLKIHQASVSKLPLKSVQIDSRPGEVVAVEENRIVVQTGHQFLEIYVVQPESRNQINISEFLKGYDLKVGDSFN